MKILTHKVLLLLLIFPVLFRVGSCFSKDLYISPSGNDKNPGTMSQPLATFEGARDKIRDIREPVVVYVRAGTYYFQKPVIFTPDDSRSKRDSVIFKPFNGEKVSISGAAAMSLKWSHFTDQIAQAQVPAGVIFDQVFLNGEKLRMARYPNFHPNGGHFGGFSEDVLSREKAASWKNPKDAFIHALHRHEWGGYHYRVTGKDSTGQLQMEGGYQNNRQMGMHPRFRFIENIFEELDTTGEWYFDKQKRILYLYAQEVKTLEGTRIESPQINSLFEFRGSESKPVRNITIDGFEFLHVLRTFMETKEPLLRSDWAIYRGGTVVMEGAENCRILNCNFFEVGGNGVFFSNYNRKNEVAGCHFRNTGASGVCFVGDPLAVRSPSFEYNEAIGYEEMDKLPGPKTNNYPAECRVYNNLMHGLGQVEKQVAGVEISMSADITVSHNTIYDVPRSGINVSEGTWGGHVIEFNDVFKTVLETGDHGSFNSWGRDRYWHPDRETMNQLVAAHPELILLDAQKTVVIRNNRFRCDHGWDIDLDDGSSNYHIYNNVCLNGGLKLREGFRRIVENNIMINNSFHPHVWFSGSGDTFRKNIVTQPYYPIQIQEWGDNIDFNLFPDEKALEAARINGTDANSLAGDPLFEAPLEGNYQVASGSPALKLGFINFPMDQFGVVSPSLKSQASLVPLPIISGGSFETQTGVVSWLGGKLRDVTDLGDRSAYGLPDMLGVIVDEIGNESILSKSPLKKGDVIRMMNKKTVRNVSDLVSIYQEISWTGNTEIEIIRNQKPERLRVSFR